MNRREMLTLAMAASGSWFGSGALADTRPLKVLIFGGTGFIGPHFVAALRSAGHELTLFNRGKRNPGLFADIETLIGDRAGKLDALQGRQWDVVIDNSGYFPAHVQASAQLLKDRVQHYIYISSISAYADFGRAGIDEDYPLAKLQDPNVTEISGGAYGGLKALCEQAVEQIYAGRQSVLRPTFIVGPGDGSDRFTYWPVRVARGGEMLAPGSPDDPIQFIDVRDLAQFVRRCVEQRIAGRYNVCNPPGAVTMGDLLELSQRVAKSDARWYWADAQFLQKHQVGGNELPIWAAPGSELAGATLVSSARAVAKGLRFRSLETTVRDTLSWHQQRPAEQKQKLRAGLSPERETQLLEELKRTQAPTTPPTVG